MCTDESDPITEPKPSASEPAAESVSGSSSPQSVPNLCEYLTGSKDPAEELQLVEAERPVELTASPPSSAGFSRGSAGGGGATGRQFKPPALLLLQTHTATLLV